MKQNIKCMKRNREHQPFGSIVFLIAHYTSQLASKVDCVRSY